MKKSKPKVKKKKKEDNIIKFDYMKTNKDNIINVINYPAHINIINDIVVKVNKIVIHTYQFLKLYLIHLYNNNKDFPIIDEDFIGYIFMVLTVRKCGSGGYTDKTMPDQLNHKFYSSLKYFLYLIFYKTTKGNIFKIMFFSFIVKFIV